MRIKSSFLSCCVTASTFYVSILPSLAFQGMPTSLISSHRVLELNGGMNTKNIPSKLSMKSKSTIDFDDIEARAGRAAENWDTEVTKFMTPEDALILEDRLSNRGDIGYIRVGGLPDSLRTRFVMTNPDLELDNFSVQAEHCVLLRVDHINTATMKRSSPWPHVFTQIGVELENVGDVVVDGEEAYMVVTPKVAKQCRRLLPKELRGIGLTVSVIDPGDYLPFDGVQQDMELGKLDKRALKYK